MPPQIEQQRTPRFGALLIDLRDPRASYCSAAVLELCGLESAPASFADWVNVFSAADRERWQGILQLTPEQPDVLLTLTLGSRRPQGSPSGHPPGSPPSSSTDGTRPTTVVLRAELQFEGAQGEATRLIGTLHSDEPLTDEERLAHARLQRVIDGTRDGPWEYNVATARYWLSPQLRALLGYTEQELPNGTAGYTGLIHRDDLWVHETALRRHLDAKDHYDAEFRLRTAAGEYRWFRSRGTGERDRRGQQRWLSGAVQDVTERRRYQQGLIEATETAVAANRAKSEFLASTSHEIRTPLNGVLGMADLLNDTELDPAQRDYAETIRNSASSLLAVVNDILDFSKLENGKLDLERADLSLLDTMERVAKLLAGMADDKGLELVLDVDPKLPATVVGDPARLQQILLNLGGSALAATEEGEVVIAAKSIDTARSRTQVRFEVRDTRPGPPELPPDAFAASMDPAAWRQLGSTSLGLSSVRRIVSLMGGEIGVDSGLTGGATIWFLVPFDIGHTSRPPATFAGTGVRLLVATANASLSAALTRKIQAFGAEVRTATSGDQAVQTLLAATQRPFDIALIDARLPGEGGGLEVGPRLAQDERLQHTRSILLTAASDRGNPEEFTNYGFVGSLPKPIAQQQLIACLQQSVRHAPLEAPHSPAQPLPSRNERPRAGEGHCVLLAEDHPVNMKIARVILEKLGLNVIVARNGRDAVAAWKNGGIDLVLMDCQMPLMTGYEATREIRRLEQGKRHIPIVALTAHAMKGDDRKCRAAGMDEYLTKPIDRQRLEACLAKYLGNPEGGYRTQM